MVYTKYLTIYDDTASSRNHQSRNANSDRYNSSEYYCPETSSSRPSARHRSTSTEKRETYINNILNTNSVSGNRNELGSLQRRSNSASNARTNSTNTNIESANRPIHRSCITKKLDYFDSKYGSNNNKTYFKLKAEPISEEMEEINPSSYAIYPICNENNGTKGSHDFFNVEIPIERAKNSYHFNNTADSGSGSYIYENKNNFNGNSSNNYYEYPKSRSNAAINAANMTSVSNNTSNSGMSPTLKLDLEISTPKNDIKISRKCKSYEVS